MIIEQLRLDRLQWFVHLQRMLDLWPQKQLLWCRLRGKNRRPSETSLQWVGIISREWQEMMTDRSVWQSIMHQPRSAPNLNL